MSFTGGISFGWTTPVYCKISSASVTILGAKGSAPLAASKADFPILFECLHAVLGLMMSHSCLCELIHGMMRHGLHSSTGMDQVDAQQAHMISTEYDLREQGQKLLLLPDDEQNAKRIKSVEHRKTKGQVDMMGVQLVDVMEELDQSMMELLAKLGHGSCLFHWSTCLV